MASIGFVGSQIALSFDKTLCYLQKDLSEKNFESFKGSLIIAMRRLYDELNSANCLGDNVHEKVSLKDGRLWKTYCKNRIASKWTKAAVQSNLSISPNQTMINIWSLGLSVSEINLVIEPLS